MKKVECHPRLYLLQAGGQCGCWQGSCGSGSCSQVELGVISIAMVGYPMLADDPAQGKQIESEKGGAQHRALGDTTDDFVGERPCFAQGDMLSSVGQV